MAKMLPLLRMCSRPLSMSLASAAPPALPQQATCPADVAQPPPKPFSQMPGLKGWPILGNALRLVKELESGKAGDDHWFHELHRKFGPVFRIKMFGDSWYVFTSSPEGAEAMFKSEGRYPIRGDYEETMKMVYQRMKLPAPIFACNGPEWKNIRVNAGNQILPRRVANFTEPLAIVADELIEHLERIKDENGNVQNMRPELQKWAFKGVSYFVYGENVDTFSGKDPAQKEFMEAGIRYLESLPPVVISMMIPINKIYPTKAFRDYRDIVMKLRQTGKDVLDRRYEKIKDAIATGTVDDTQAVGLLDQFLIEGKFTESEALSHCYDMLSAGIDTTANTAVFLLYELARHPEIQNRLFEEITPILGDKKHPSWDDLQQMTLARNCVKEVSRLHCAVEQLSRVTAIDSVIGGYMVPAGTPLMFHSNTASKAHFKDPRDFKPDRWNKDADDEKINPYSSLPFGFGPRSCYGRRVAELELYVLMAKIIPRYVLSTNLKEMQVKRFNFLTPRKPVHLKFTPRHAVN